jgi:hypothetical protein
MYSCNVNGHIGTGRTQAQAEIAAGYAMLNGLDKADIDDAIPGWDEAVKAQFSPRQPINYQAIDKLLEEEVSNQGWKPRVGALKSILR